MTQKSLNDALRNAFMEIFTTALGEDYDILMTNSNEYAIPCVDAEGNEKFCVVKFSIPTGSREGDAYDGYALAEEYSQKMVEKEEKAKQAKIAKEKKIAKDKANREKLAASKKAHTGTTERNR